MQQTSRDQQSLAQSPIEYANPLSFERCVSRCASCPQDTNNPATEDRDSSTLTCAFSITEPDPLRFLTRDSNRGSFHQRRVISVSKHAPIVSPKGRFSWRISCGHIVCARCPGNVQVHEIYANEKVLVNAASKISNVEEVACPTRNSPQGGWNIGASMTHKAMSPLTRAETHSHTVSVTSNDHEIP